MINPFSFPLSLYLAFATTLMLAVIQCIFSFETKREDLTTAECHVCFNWLSLRFESEFFNFRWIFTFKEQNSLPSAQIDFLPIMCLERVRNHKFPLRQKLLSDLRLQDRESFRNLEASLSGNLVTITCDILMIIARNPLCNMRDISSSDLIEKRGKNSLKLSKGMHGNERNNKIYDTQTSLTSSPHLFSSLFNFRLLIHTERGVHVIEWGTRGAT